MGYKSPQITDFVAGTPVNGDIIEIVGGVPTWVLLPNHAVGITVGDGTNVPATGLKGIVRVPWAGTLTQWSICANAVGSIQFDVWKTIVANYPPTVANTITAADKPKIVTNQYAEGTALTGWTKTVTEGDIFAFNVDSVATISRATLILVIKPA